ncbi:reverse transcriptase [Plakobranchus ocellatus]|uniref:Reverse transcriptase n=1 Tax=Plakobranchus ocellatus TaxID=259542 RepID=A0AAV4BZV6_9GAST|nr:reverse transcriptase [Plakobranchus ocellatus]
MASRLTNYLTENGYINTSIQKGGIPGVSGCLEHATMIWEAIQRAKLEKLNLDVIWLDLANAYGSVPHEMIQLDLRMYHVPEVIQVMLDDYFSGFRMRFSTNNYTTNWINLEVGIAMGCTISPILFVMAMEVILKAAEASAGPANLGGGCSMPSLKAFMDDTVICSKEDETRRMLTRLDDLMSWCRMEFKPKKSRSLGKVDEATTFTVAKQQIPTVSQEPVKSRGRWKWLGVPPGLSDVAIYYRKAKLKLPMKSILEEYKCGKARLLTMLEESDDHVVKTVQPSLKTGRKWKVTEAIDEAKECLKMKELIGQTQTDHRGLGSTTAKWWSKTEGKEKRDMIIDEIRNKEDSTRVQNAVQQPQQAASHFRPRKDPLMDSLFSRMTYPHTARAFKDEPPGRSHLM